jgi:YidC/Oxa1 family membrane protein insertase
LYRAEGTSAWAGIGPALLQLPVFTVVYRLFLSPSVGGHANLLLAHTLLGVPLGRRWLFAAGAFGPHGLIFLGLAALLALLAWWAVRRTPATPGGALLRLLPFGTVAAAAYLPLAAVVYLLTTTACTTAERALLSRAPIAA